MINRIVYTLNEGTLDEVVEEVNLSFLFSDLKVGSNTIKIEAFDNLIKKDEKIITVNKTGGGGSTLDVATEELIGAIGLPNDATPSIHGSLTNAEVVALVDDFIKFLKANSIWDSLPVFYIALGDTESKNGINWKNPVALPLVWFGGWVHSSMGMQANQTDTIAYVNNSLSNPFDNGAALCFKGRIGQTLIVNSANPAHNNFKAIVDAGVQSSASLDFSITSHVGTSAVNKVARVRLANTQEITEALDDTIVRGIMTVKVDEGTQNLTYIRNQNTPVTITLPSAPPGFIKLPAIGIVGTSLAPEAKTSPHASNQRYSGYFIHDGLTTAKALLLHAAIDTLESGLGRKTW